MPPIGAKTMLCPLMETLLRKNTRNEEKAEAYQNLSQQLRNNTAEAIRYVRTKCPDFLNVILEDGSLEKTDLCNAALQTLGICLHEVDFTSELTTTTIGKIVLSLCDIINKSKEKTVCTRALWCFSVQEIPRVSLKVHIPKIVSVLEHAMFVGNVRSPVVEHECVNVVSRLLDQCPDGMESETVKWAKLIYPMLVNTVSKVRERALTAMNRGLPLILKNGTNIEAIGGDLLQDLQVLLLSEMEQLNKQHNEVFVLNAWVVYVKLLGKRLHSGSFLNRMLPIVENGFKSAKSEIRMGAYQAWKALIDCFALNRAILEETRRVKLIMQVFRLTTAKDEKVALKKLDVWWHYVVTLKPSNPALFDQVVMPLFNFCLGVGKSEPNTPGKGISPSTPGRTPVLRRNASGGLTSPPTPNSSLNGSGMSTTPNSISAPSGFVFKTVQLKAMEVLALLMAVKVDGINIPEAKFTVDKPDRNLVDQQVFTKHGNALVNAARDLLFCVGRDVQDGILYRLWYGLVEQLKHFLENGNRKENVDVFTSVLYCTQDIVSNQAIEEHKILKMIEAMTRLPSKLMHSSAYNAGTLTGSAVMHGCPAFTLMDLIFQDRLLKLAKEERFFIVMEKLITHGVTNPVRALSFLQTCMERLQNSVTVLTTDILWRMWSVIVNPLLEHIMKSNEVNQGDALEHNFTCLYKALEFPLVRLLTSDLHQGSLKSMLKTWSELYTTFARLAAMVPNAEANVCCEELCDRILTSGIDEILRTGIGVEHFAAISKVMTDTLDFSSLMQPNILSPVKFGKRKHKILGNLNGLVKLVAFTTEALHALAAIEIGIQKNVEPIPSLVASANDLTHVMSQLFNDLPTSTMITASLEKLSSPASQFFSGAAKRSSKLYTQQFQQKLEKLWLDISTCIEGRYKGVYDSDFLAVTSSLFCVTFLHPRRAIKNQAIILWNATFAQSQPLKYPEELKPVLTKVKEKTPIVLPGWSSVDVSVIEETPVSQMSQAGESNAPVPNIVGMPSPLKAHGSFMNRAVSPNIKKSPMLSRKSPKSTTSPGPVRKRIALEEIDDLSSSKFVVIKNSPKKKMVLTEHQKEKMQEQSWISPLIDTSLSGKQGSVPALYSSVDVSMDASLMSQFVSTESQSSTPTPTPTPPVSFAPFKFPSSTSGDIKRKTPTDVKKEANKNQEKNGPDKKKAFEGESPNKTDEDSRPRTRSGRKSVKFSTGSEQDKNTEESDAPAASTTNSSEEVMDLSKPLQSREYDTFGFMTPSGDSVKSNDSTEKVQPTIVDGKGDHAPEDKTENKDNSPKMSQPEVVDNDVEMVDPDLTVAEELSEAQKYTPNKEDASKLKDFVLGRRDSDTSRDVTSDNECEVMEIDDEKLSETKIIEKTDEKEEEKKPEEKEEKKVSLFSTNSSEVASSMETKPESDDGLYTRIKGRRTKRPLVASSPVRSSPRSKKGSTTDIRNWIIEKSPKKSLSDPNPVSSSRSSKQSTSAASASEVLVEDSQQYSPGKCIAKNTSLLSETVVEESQQCSPSKTQCSSSSEETSVRLDFSGAFDSTVVAANSKTLLSESVADSSESQLPQEAERPELPTPTKRPPVKDAGSPASPVVKLYKLSQEDIIKLSPSKQATNDAFAAPFSSSPRSVGRGVKRRASLLRVSKAASQEKKADSQEKKSEDDGKKINIDDIIPSSQDAFAFAVQNSLIVEETQFTPKALEFNKEKGKEETLSADVPENLKNTDENSCRDTSDTETTVIEKGEVSKDRSDQGESLAKASNDAKDVNSENQGSPLKSGTDLLVMSDTYSESGNDANVSNTGGSICPPNSDILPADIDVSQDSENDSQATIVSSRVKRRKSKRMLDELKGPSELPDNESSEISQPTQSRRRGRPKKKVPSPKQGGDSSLMESTDGQKPESSDADSSFSEAGDNSKTQAKPRDLKTKLAVSTLASDIASSQEFSSERPGQDKTSKFKVPKVPDETPVEEVVVVDDSSQESDDSVVYLGDDTKTTERKEKAQRKKSDKTEARSKELEKASSMDKEVNVEGTEKDINRCSQSSQERNLRSRTVKGNISQDVNDSIESAKGKTTEKKKSESKEKKMEESTVSKEEKMEESDDDVPLNKLKPENDIANADAAKSPGGPKSDDDDAPLSLYLSKSQSSDDAKSSQEASAPKEQNAEQESVDLVDIAPPQSCADMFVDSEQPEESNKDNEGKTNGITDTAADVGVNDKESSQGQKTKKEIGRNVQFVKTGRGRRGRLSLDSRKRKSPGTSPKGSLRLKRGLGLKGRGPSSPIVAISPLSKANKALVEKQLSQIMNKENESETTSEGENSKVEVVDLKSGKSNQETSSVENQDSDAQSSDKKQMGTLHSLNKGVSRSPPKKGRPFDSPETPTSASKFTSRSQYILERSRRICLAKASPSPLSGRKLLVPKKSPRGILKHSPTSKSPDKDGNNGPLAAIHGLPQASKLPSHSDSPPTFRPIQIPKIYSPSASPSAGILKRRRLSGDTPTESPSPPNKQRRVCFNDSLDVCELTSRGESSPSKPINRCLEMGSRTLVPSPLVRSAPSKMQTTATSSKFVTTPSKSSSDKSSKDEDGFAIPDVVSAKRPDTNDSEGSCLSTQDVSQMNCNDPVCPDLLECDASVDEILPQLTSSMWMRGLGQLVRAKNIRTVGQLSAMSEYDINSLPIREPKVSTTKSALASFAEQWRKRSEKHTPQKIKANDATKEIVNGIVSPEKEVLPSADDAIDVSPVKALDFDTSMNSDQEEDPLAALKENTINMEPPNVVEEAVRVLGSVNSTANVIQEPIRSPTRKKLLKDMKDIKQRMTPAVLFQLPSHQLVDLHQQLNEMMTSVVIALKSKCAASPQVSQSSQSDSD